MRWEIRLPGDRTAQILPIADLIEHSEDSDCVCQPSLERVDNEDGGDAWVVTHHSLDGRELTEVDRATTPQGPPRCGMPEVMLAFGLALAVITFVVVYAITHH